MGISGIVMTLAGMLLVALLLKSAAQRLHLPFAALLVFCGFVGSELVVWLGYDTGLNYIAFHDLIMFVFLPILVFDAAFKIDAALLRRNLFAILLLAVPILLLSVVLTAVLVYFGIAHPEGFPWIAALLTGAVLAATDASPLTNRFAEFGVHKRLRVLMDGEDLFNDATAIVTFSIILYIALHPQEQITSADVILRFCVVFFGGILVGLMVGLGSLLLSRLFHDHVHQALVTIVSAYTSFLLADQVLNVSGVMAVLITGLVMGRVIHEDFQERRGTFVDEFWNFNGYLAEALMFLLMGMVVTWGMFERRWLAMLIGIVAVLVARAVGVALGSLLIARLRWVDPIAPGHQRVMVAGSLRGAVVLALALSLPVELDYWWTVQSIAFGVVLFSLFVQAPYAERLVRRLPTGDAGSR